MKPTVYTGYKDVNGEKVYTGDTIDFAVPQRDGTTIHKVGRITKLQYGFAFYHNKTYKMLSQIKGFDSQCDCRIIKKIVTNK